MASKALLIGGSGQIGRAVAARLLTAGWDVTCAQTRPERVPQALIQAGASIVALDREAPGALAAATVPGFDAVIDMVAYDEGHARQLLAVQGDIGAFVVMSSGSVYRDAEGRTLDEARETGFPQFPVPIPETQPTVPPGPATYSTRKSALEQTLLQEAATPVTILRPFAIHGEGSGHCREWWFVKRLLDGRTRIPLVLRGESRFHTTATANIAELVATVLAAPRTQVLNAADPEAPSVADIGRAIAAVYGASPELVLLDGPRRDDVGRTPWSVPSPLVADMSAAAAIGYRAVTTYADAVALACRSAEARAAAGEPFAPYFAGTFDYAAEDRVMDAH
jgi:nucleoside-diphosphate-sugar epimerase